MISVFGLAGGPLLGVIVMGMFFPCVNGAVSCFKNTFRLNSNLVLRLGKRNLRLYNLFDNRVPWLVWLSVLG